MKSFLDIENGIGLAAVLKANRLKVPANQREYSWEEENVLDYLQDIGNSLKSGKETPYFLGTIVLTKTDEEELSVADGQQRLATTCIVLSEIRNRFNTMGDSTRAGVIESEFLFTVDMESAEEVPRLTLNLDDHAFFLNAVLKGKTSTPIGNPSSHKLILGAVETVTNYFNYAEAQYGSRFSQYLIDWSKHLRDKSCVLPLIAPDSMSAFAMFATLNDRGVKTSQVDIVKNWLFEQAELSNREHEAHKIWSSIRAIVESISDKDDFLLEYMRWVCCLEFGVTREKDIFKNVSEHSRGSLNAILFLEKMNKLAEDYAAIYNPQHKKWYDYNPSVRQSLRTLASIGFKQMRPLLLAISASASTSKTPAMFESLVSWLVRMTVAGGTKAGRLDQFYADLGHKVYTKEIKSYAQLKKAAIDKLPTDIEFSDAFEQVRVRVPKKARYYLRSLERTANGSERHPSLIPNEDVEAVNLEHVMPKAGGENWKHITTQDLETHADRLGNLALLATGRNKQIDRDPFEEKREYFKQGECPFLLTQMIYEDSKGCVMWGTKHIELRQKKLAELASKTWTI